MQFSDYFDLGDVSEEEWFDPFLSIDTKLFIDPFLIYDNEVGRFLGSHEDIVRFFETAFELIADSNGDQSARSWRKAENLLRFPEVEELCLGYTIAGTRGAGSGSHVAHGIALALWNAIDRGMEEIRHFEEVQLFEEGIGPDRISDATAGVLRHRIAQYTAEIAANYDLPCQRIRYQRGEFDSELGRWVAREFDLPINPYTERPIFLIPKRYLRPLPTINPMDYWQYCFDNDLDLLREMFGDDITRHVNKEAIVRLASQHPETQQRYVSYREGHGSEPYDFHIDPAGMTAWYGETRKWVGENPQELSFSNPEEFQVFVDAIVYQFRNFVENNGGWRLLWNENETPRREQAAQLLFLGITKHYCQANNVDISAEANIGRGPVDFKVASGYRCRSLIELKLAKNTKFWNGLERQLPK